jgi:flagellar hook-basal body complex protein FliE
MTISPLGVYQKVTALSEPAVRPVAAKPQSEKPTAAQSFMDAVAEAAHRAAATVEAGETAAMGGIAGTMDSHQVVAAMSKAELTIQATIAIRDKMVQAYQEIMRMPV